jgi:hypothetical protein
MSNLSQKELKSLKQGKFQEISLYDKLDRKSKKERKSISGKVVDFLLKSS